MTFAPLPEPVDISFAIQATHRVRFTRDVFGCDQQVLADVLEPSGERPARVQFWLDEHLATACPDLRHKIHHFTKTHADRVVATGNVQIAPGGEVVKNEIHLLERMLKVFNAANLDRRSYVVVIGGGAVLDAVGFAAAIAHRGIRLVRLPTTTLGQADSGIGVKNSVNLFGKKNWIGTFAVPWAVINDAALLESLSQRDFIGGFSEAVKVSLLKDPALFDALCSSATAIARRDMAAAQPMIRASAGLHLAHITQGGDPFEMNEARPLDFGHWSAHKLEVMSEFALRHGEAVAIGVAIDTVYSSRVHGLPASDAARVLACLWDLGFSLSSPALADSEVLFAGLEEFRQHLGGRLTLTMLRAIGRAIDVHEVDRDQMQAAIEQVAQYAATRSAERRQLPAK